MMHQASASNMAGIDQIAQSASAVVQVRYNPLGVKGGWEHHLSKFCCAQILLPAGSISIVAEFLAALGMEG